MAVQNITIDSRAYINEMCLELFQLLIAIAINIIVSANFKSKFFYIKSLISVKLCKDKDDRKLILAHLGTQAPSWGRHLYTLLATPESPLLLERSSCYSPTLK